jgi:cyclic dehypoxanthinyl futalosine synthase
VRSCTSPRVGLAHEEVITDSRSRASTPSPARAREILVARPRNAIAPLKESGETWLAVMETAHTLGRRVHRDVHDGHRRDRAERIEHLRMVRAVQDRTGGFRAFIPWTYQPENNHLKGDTKASALEYLR